MLDRVQKRLENDPSKLDWNELEQSEIVSWIESDLSGLDAYDLAEAYPETEVSETEGQR